MSLKILELKIEGMTCPSCSAAVERCLDELEGIQEKIVDHHTDSGKIAFDESIISEEEIIAKINEGHYKVAGFENIENALVIPECPECAKSGQLVPNTVFQSNLKTESLRKINLGTKNFICFNPDCKIAYYNEEIKIDLSELKRELWFKKGSKRKIICYCNNIDSEQIKEAILNHQLTTWEEITSHYRSKVLEKCEIINPTGYCCRANFKKEIDKFTNQ
ncbi:cation transporter [Ancylomarina longa]|uniref:HMA domain-containing protein n=1 Tax=Ancylomarina longa TaxID=2487017 RepID=A0A434AZ78_9BACT|nr:cation transporter [Ancylomarina longa]RUT79717.1 hypothetical protein DLK05_03270 [Ancylomarina longa]